MAQVQITRIVEREDSKRAYKIFVNEAFVRIIEVGETISFVVPPGEHEIRLKVDWCFSPKQKFKVETGKTLFLECGNNVPKLFFLIRGFVGAYIVLFDRNNYLWLKQVEH